MFKPADSDVDAKWKGAIERALGSWETVVEWADYIAFLSRLQKAVRTRAGKDSRLPLAPQIAEYLSRCLEPALPAGVHQTAMEVYNTVFTALPEDQLYSDMNVWLPGILPVVSYAAFNVKPLVVEFIGKYILTSPHLRGLCRPLFAACLPSLEDENGECFNEILDLVSELRSRLNDDVFFWQTLFLTVITSSDTSLGFLTYCNKHLPNFANTLSTEARLATSPEPGIFVRSVCTGLTDPNVLVQRGFLDILARNLPLDSEVLVEKASRPDVRQLIYAACRTITKKDMSLNRRLWSWLLGPEPDPSEPAQLHRVDFFERYALSDLVSVLMDNLKSSDLSLFAEACIVIHGLMDRWELASRVVPQVLVPVIRAAIPLRDDDTAMSAAKQLFDGIEARLIWSSAIELINTGEIETIIFMITTFDLQDEEMVFSHIPNALFVTSYKLLGVEGERYEKLALRLVTLLQRASLSLLETTEIPHDALQRVENYYASAAIEEADFDPEPAVTQQVFTYALTKNFIEFYCRMVEKANEFEDTDSYLELEHNQLLVRLLSLFPSYSFRSDRLNACLVEAATPDSAVFRLVADTMTRREQLRWFQNLADYCFVEVSEGGTRQVEVIRDLWGAKDALGGYDAASALAASFSKPGNSALEVCSAFSALWTHSVDRSDYASLLSGPAFQFIDLLSANPEEKRIAQHYLHMCVIVTGKVEKLLQLVIDALKTNVHDKSLHSYYMGSLLQLVTEADKIVKRVFLEKFAQQAVDLFYEWLISEDSSTEGPYHHGLRLILLMHEGVTSGKEASGLMDHTTRLIEHSGYTKSNLSLMTFVSEALRVGQQGMKVTFNDDNTYVDVIFKFVQSNIGTGSTQIGAAGLCLLFDSFLAAFEPSIPQLVSVLTTNIISRLDELDQENLAPDMSEVPDSDLVIQLLLCLERLLATCLRILLSPNEQQAPDGKEPSPTPSPGGATSIFNNVISGVFSVESPGDRRAMENARALLLEAMDASMKKCCSYWKFFELTRARTLYQSEYTTALYATSRLKTRVRKLTSLFYRYSASDTTRMAVIHSDSSSSAVRLAHVFEATRYKQTIQVIVSEVEAQATAKDRLTEAQGTLSGKYIDFMLNYVRSLEPDVMEDVWSVLIGFFVELNSRSSQYPTVLMPALYLAQIMAGKIKNASFASRKKVRKDFSDNYLRLITYALSELPQSVILGEALPNSEARFPIAPLLPDLHYILPDAEKQATVFGKLMSVSVAPVMRRKEPLSSAPLAVFELLELISEHSAISKVWRSNIGDLLFDADERLFTASLPQVKLFLPVLEKWAQSEKERLADFYAKIANFGSNSVLFGWSGSDELTNSNLLRLALLHLSTDNLAINYQKLVNQLAVLWKNPKFLGNVCILLRALLLSREPSKLLPIYTFLAFKLQEVFTNLRTAVQNGEVSDRELRDSTNLNALIEATRTLDFALTLNSDYFHIYEWLFIRDNTDAVYPHDDQPRDGDIIDKIASEQILRRIDDGFTGMETFQISGTDRQRRPMLSRDTKVRNLHYFYNRASITWYETAYAMKTVDWDFMRDLVIEDLLHS